MTRLMSIPAKESSFIEGNLPRRLTSRWHELFLLEFLLFLAFLRAAPSAWLSVACGLHTEQLFVQPRRREELLVSS